MPVEVLSLDGAVELPTGALRTHHAPGDNLEGLSWDRWAGVTDDGYVVRIRRVHETDTISFGLVDPMTGRTEWLPQAGYEFGRTGPLRLATDDGLPGSAVTRSGAVEVYDRVAGRWSSQTRFGAFDLTASAVPNATAVEGAGGRGDRLWSSCYEASADYPTECTGPTTLDFTCYRAVVDRPVTGRRTGSAVRCVRRRIAGLGGRDGVSASAEGLTS